MRGAICKSLADKIRDGVNGTNYANLYGNVSTQNLHFDQINDFPYCTVTPGSSTREYLPSNFTWAYLDVRIRLYIKDAEDAQGKLELLIADIENLIDSNLTLEYTITKASGDTETRYTTNSTVASVTTDEGILAPLGFAEISIQIQYQK
jgi:hypothetical protein